MSIKVPFSEFSELVGAIYEAPLSDPPWHPLTTMRQALAAKDVVLILRQPSETGVGVSFVEGSSEAAAADSAYIKQQIYALDPFVNLPPNEPVLLSEIIDDESLRQHEFYRLCLKDADIFHILGVDIRNSSGMRANLRITRSHSQPPFGAAEKAFCAELVPHIARALRIHDRISEVESERSIYANVMTQLAVATILLDEQRKVVRTNPLAEHLLARGASVRLVDGKLQLDQAAENQRLRELIGEIVEAQRHGKTTMARAMLIDDATNRAQLSLVVRAVPPADRPEGLHEPVAAVFISAPDYESEASAQLLSDLFQLTRTETRLAILFASGHSVESVSDELCISRHTTRAHLRSIFSKTGVSRQTQLVRLVLKSLATLG